MRAPAGYRSPLDTGCRHGVHAADHQGNIGFDSLSPAPFAPARRRVRPRAARGDPQRAHHERRVGLAHPHVGCRSPPDRDDAERSLQGWFIAWPWHRSMYSHESRSRCRSPRRSLVAVLYDLAFQDVRQRVRTLGRLSCEMTRAPAQRRGTSAAFCIVAAVVVVRARRRRSARARRAARRDIRAKRTSVCPPWSLRECE